MDDSGHREAAPLVRDGVMYLPNPRGVIQALDGANGDLIWEYRPGTTPGLCAIRTAAESNGHPSSRSASRKRRHRSGPRHSETLAIFDDKIFATTNEASSR
jgi:hypothetical protein